MNETSNQNPDSSNQNTANQSSHTSSRRGLFESMRSAINDGARQARAAAEKAAPKVKTALSDATYWSGYGTSFAAVFLYTLVAELAPEELKAGGRDGAHAGRAKAEKFASRCKPHPTEGAPVDPSAPSVQPGAA